MLHQFNILDILTLFWLYGLRLTHTLRDILKSLFIICLFDSFLSCTTPMKSMLQCMMYATLPNCMRSSPWQHHLPYHKFLHQGYIVLTKLDLKMMIHFSRMLKFCLISLTSCCQLMVLWWWTSNPMCMCPRSSLNINVNFGPHCRMQSGNM